MAAHSSVLAWRIPGTGSLVGCRLWGRAGSDRTEATAAAAAAPRPHLPLLGLQRLRVELGFSSVQSLSCVRLLAIP